MKNWKFNFLCRNHRRVEAMRFGAQCVVTVLISITSLLVASSGGAQIGDIALPENNFVLENRDLVIEDHNGRVRVRLDAQTGDLRLFDVEGNQVQHLDVRARNFWLGGFGMDGDILLFPADAVPPTGGSRLRVVDATVRLDADRGSFVLGGVERPGRMALRGDDGVQTMFLDGGGAQLFVGSEGEPGRVRIRRNDGTSSIFLQGSTGRVEAESLQLEGEGITFADGTVQQTAQRVGPKGPVGPVGPPGPRGPRGLPGVSQFAVCVRPGSTTNGSCNCGTGSLVSRVFAENLGTCQAVTTVGSCSAGSSVSFSGSCCVCTTP